MPARISAELSQLARLARDGGLDLSQVSLRVKADLLMTMPQPPQDDLTAFGEMAQALIPSIDEATAVILARKLAGWRHSPSAVLQALKARGGPVAAALLRHGMALPEAEIELLAEQGDADIAAAAAERPDLTATATLILVDRDDRAVDLTLIANLAAPLPRAALDQLVARSRRDCAYAPGLLSRRDVSSTELAPLFLQAGPERRLAILDSLAAIEALGGLEPRRPAPAADLFAGWLAMAGDDQQSAFGAIASHLGGADTLADALAADRSRDLAALALVASGTSVENATRFLIRLGDETAHSVERIFALVALMRSVRPEIAHRVVMQVAGVRSAPAQRKGQHLPAMDPSGTAARGGPARQDGSAMISGAMRQLGLRREQV
jgi:uncharacterized protein (DUF2336 family)